MFSGIVEGVAQVTAVVRADAVKPNLKLELRLPFAEPAVLPIGSSLAVNGCCLTVLQQHEALVTFEVGAESMRLTNLGQLQVGDSVNIERPLLANGRLDGHIVSGHIDCMSTVRASYEEAELQQLFINLPPHFRNYIIPKGSITVDGISLTVNSVNDEGFSVALLPFTHTQTTLGKKRPGALVNLEFDLVGKYLVRYLENNLKSEQRPTLETRLEREL